ncbi:M14 family metallopeptidase [Sphingobacterium oryzagri]|uniref:M14 family metallopeptidase n=1 Tax=Sphingobacterium oryzagri TaxID=3025669 RepID=A0ABY7WKA7_9SPHI|nr:M14 family metallopeptidase [Sphingobacterium sp. KACC 22765]WDF69057.1 M14 family metallopeptidase [Sphingobacterium sp. KACC 22765]
MKKSLLGLLCLAPFLGWAQLNYPSYANLTSEIQQAASSARSVTQVIGKSFGGEEIRVIKIESSASPKPTLLIVAGIDGKHPAGTLSALQLAKNLQSLPSDSLTALMRERSIWIVPLLNPDAYKRNIASGHWQSGNARVIDNDRDGRIDEDPAQDLNNDGIIAQMRVTTAAGGYVAHDTYPHYLIPNERDKGQKGVYALYTEGKDADKDGLFGEDGAAGVNINRNFTFNYPAFTSESGEYAASEPETRAIVDFVFDNPQIATVLHFGLDNNLSEPVRYDSRKASERIISAWLEKDAQAAAQVSHLYNKTTSSLGQGPKFSESAGNFSNTAYYHMGKFSFTTPLWWPALTDTASTTKESAKGKSGDALFLQWLAANNVSGALLPWVKVDHPDFPNQTVEVGGLVEVFRNNPPAAFLDETTKLHTDFVLQLLNSMATLQFDQPVVTALGENIYRIDLRVANVGLLPTYPEIADKIKHVAKMKAVCALQKNQKFLSGKRLQLYSALHAGEALSLSWLVQGKGVVEITAGCPTAGEQTIKVTL